LTLCLLPYLISSIYSIVTALLEMEGVPDWLWGDWIYGLVGDSGATYMILAEGPICCVGALGFLIVVMGLVISIGGVGDSGPVEPRPRIPEYEPYIEPDIPGYEAE
jgi:hypothetical protein